MLSLLVVRHLSDSILQPDVLNYYLEMYVRIRNAGGDVAEFLNRPLRKHPPKELEISSAPESEYVHEVFHQFNFEVPDETLLQILRFIHSDISKARHHSNFEGDPVSKLWVNWNLMQSVWNAFVHLLKHPLLSNSNPTSQALDCCFDLCEEMEHYRAHLHGSDNTKLYNTLTTGLCLLFDSVSSDEFYTLKNHSRFNGIKALAHSVNLFLVGARGDEPGVRLLWKSIGPHYSTHGRQDSEPLPIRQALGRRPRSPPVRNDGNRVEIPQSSRG
ncbi:hypothetical protein BDQ17DRAFT_1362458 [Cyathus striatus]|nr:hypothetical protein BDQ17DRAFT_1362458 [Cyathus striatus]